jgi:hypothetical protein
MFDGPLLIQLHDIYKKSPQLLYQMLAKNLDVNLLDMTKFLSEFNKLFQ